MSRAPILLAFALLALALPLPSLAAGPAAECSDAELRADVPALSSLHEVIVPLWHEAWPEKNLGRMRELMPKIRTHVAALGKAELPGILRDKKAKWDAGVEGVAASAGKLESALAANETQAALDAAEALHAGFEGLVRTIRPRMPELDAYHQVLYRVYHYDLPNKDLAALRTHAQELLSRSAALQAATVPQRFAARAKELREGFVALGAATAELQAAAAGGEGRALEAAVEKVHSRYQSCETMFD